MSSPCRARGAASERRPGASGPSEGAWVAGLPDPSVQGGGNGGARPGPSDRTSKSGGTGGMRDSLSSLSPSPPVFALSGLSPPEIGGSWIGLGIPSPDGFCGNCAFTVAQGVIFFICISKEITNHTSLFRRRGKLEPLAYMAVLSTEGSDVSKVRSANLGQSPEIEPGSPSSLPFLPPHRVSLLFFFFLVF